MPANTLNTQICVSISHANGISRDTNDLIQYLTSPHPHHTVAGKKMVSWTRAAAAAHVAERKREREREEGEGKGGGRGEDGVLVQDD